MAIFPLIAAALLLEAESFADRGGWTADCQFMDQMGSPYLLAHGMGVPVAPARTTAKAPAPGAYRLWVRTRDWVAPQGPGRFAVAVNGRRSSVVFGVGGGGEWRWTDGGVVELAAENTVELLDLTGFEGRCDALLFAPVEATARPPDDFPWLTRRTLLGLPPVPDDGGKFDFAVVGGGYAGLCAAVAAARDGVKTVLVQDRPVFGGNASSEVRVAPKGKFRDVGPFPAMAGLVAELQAAGDAGIRAEKDFRYVQNDANVRAWLARETNLTVVVNTRVVRTEKAADGRIAAVVGRDVRTGRETRFAARFFADCTGDACVAVQAGATVRTEPEEAVEFGESLGGKPGKLIGGLGASNYAVAVWTEREEPFPACPWALRVDCDADAHLERPSEADGGRFAFATGWDWESGFYEDDVRCGEKIRDRNFRAAFGTWDYLKNRSAGRAKYAKAKFGWMGYVLGKRNARRIVGDYILTEGDLVESRTFADGVVPATWHIDLHFPDPDQTAKYPGDEFRAFIQVPGKPAPAHYDGQHRNIRPTAIPFRCLYSKDVPNLLMAGKDISATYVALASIRVMRTGGLMGVAIGKAVSVCLRKSLLPRDLGGARFGDLAEALRAETTGNF